MKPNIEFSKFDVGTALSWLVVLAGIILFLWALVDIYMGNS